MLTSLKKMDMLQMKSNANRISTQERDKTRKTKNGWPSGFILCSSGMNLVFVGAEVAPWSKTGGLGDVLGGLPPALAAYGHRVMTVAPRYDQYADAWDTNAVVDVWGKTGSKIYGPTAGVDYEDNQLRFSLLCQAALEAPRVLNLNSLFHTGPYGEEVIFIANDWHSALVPSYLKSKYKSKGIYKNAKVVFCIHNTLYQGRNAFSDFSLLNLPEEFKASFDFIDGHNKPVKGRKINWMKAGILEADRVMTVSPYYAQEIASCAAKGVELNSIIHKTGITGIVNGMDVQEWNPFTDKFIVVKYDAETVMEAKPILKETLQAELGLPVDRNIPLIGFIGRLEEQKGSDILAAAIPEFLVENVQIVILGTGKRPMEKQIEELEMMNPNKARALTKFNVQLAHMITAGADFMLIPSRFEPCGLIQLHAMRYGTCETVDPADVTAVATGVKRALSTYATPAFKEMVQNCMAQDLSWKGPAKQWEKMLLSLEVGGGEPGLEGDEIAPLAMENIPKP
ncbi:hypothetical protein Nepgr_028507 [Nepenthes gracilis]|uniref:Starch synthase catalytic domain-containing protein n=1 Tax=Nepenthes gracilis TaxID=150966 RepID=A0AAD3TCE3_NEPGR|nr:hypothetical protein Nepgr_028507 [Nepenthes gracilis]